MITKAVMLTLEISFLFVLEFSVPSRYSAFLFFNKYKLKSNTLSKSSKTMLEV